MDRETPYVGPRSFREDEADRFFGRDDEAARLLALVTSNRAVVLYAQSGAGKSSLINAGLLPKLRQMDIEVVPAVRVTRPGSTAVQQMAEPTPQDETETPRDSITSFEIKAAENAAEGLDLDVPWAGGRPTLSMLLDTIEDRTDNALMLVLDQFEELFTQHPRDWRERETFLRRLARLLDERPQLRLLLSTREEWLADIDQRRRYFRNGLNARLRLTGLSRRQAVMAIREPSRHFATAFSDRAARRLADDLAKRKVVDENNTTWTVNGPDIQPVQLQVVCMAKWNDSEKKYGEIKEQDVDVQNSVDDALENYYNKAIYSVVDSGIQDERSLRDWIETQLITPSGTRGFAYIDTDSELPVSTAQVSKLQDWHIIKIEQRAGAQWADLSHDRLIDPIKRANARRRSDLSTLEWLREQQRIRVGVNWAPPYCYIDEETGEWTGEAVELAKEVFPRIGIGHVEFKFVQATTLFEDLYSGEFDAVSAGLYITEERKQWYRFSFPSHRDRPGMMHCTERPISARRYAEIAETPELRVGVIAGAYEYKMLQEFGVPTTQIETFENGSQVARALRDGTVHVFAANTVFLEEVRKEIDPEKFEVIRGFEDPSLKNPHYELHAAMMFRRSDEDLAQEVDRVIRTLLREPGYAQKAAKFGIDPGKLPNT